MRRSLSWILLTSLLGCATQPPHVAGNSGPPRGSAETPVAPAVPDLDKEVSDLLSQLGSEDYDVRQAARIKLVALGPDVLSHLQRGSDDADPEVAATVRSIIDQLTPSPERGMAASEISWMGIFGGLPSEAPDYLLPFRHGVFPLPKVR